jgi:hypothetical protein
MASPRQQLVLSIAGAALLLAASAGMAFVAMQQYEEQVTLEEKLARSEADAQNALRQARESVALSQRVSARFQALQHAGLFDPIDKPRAIDRAEAVLHPYAATVARYQIGGGRELAPAPLAPAARYQIEIQRVAVDFEPLHEERFLDVWEAMSGLRGPAGGVESCELHRPTREVVENSAGNGQLPPIKARCLLTWYRLQGVQSPALAPAGGGDSAMPGAEPRKSS